MVGSILHSSFLVVLLCRSVLSGDVKCKTGIGSEKGMILEKKETFEIAKCAAIFCSTIDGKYQWNEWYATYPNATKEECLNDTTSDIVKGRTEHNLPIGKWTDWVCTCQFGASGVDMANAKFEPPTEKMKCKSGFGNEQGMIKEEVRECFNMKCGAIFCVANDGMYQWNRWSCFANSLQQKNCTKDGVHASAYEREKYKLSASADDWNCKCLFGEYWKDMTNVHFAPQPTIKPPTTTANVTVINAGSIGQDVGMMGFIIVLPLFRAILEQLNYN